MYDRIIIVGAGRSSSELVGRLSRHGPVMLVDTSSDAIDVAISRQTGDELLAVNHPVLVRVADASSRLVLEDLRGDPQAAVAIVIATGDDRTTGEICRLATELGYRLVIPIVNEPELGAACEKMGARSVVKAQLLGQIVEQTVRQGGTGAGTVGIGFGGGELAEFRVLPSSPAIGVPLTGLRADRWRVAAIYRGDALVLPTGKTTIEAEDRVLVVGDPSVLPHVTETLRVGMPTFPLLHGPNVVVYLPRGRDAAIEDEAEMLARRTRASGLVRLYPGATAARATMTPDPTASPSNVVNASNGSRDPPKRVEDAPLEGSTFAEHLASVMRKLPGVVVARPPARGFGDVVFGRGGPASSLCNDARVPVLFPRGATTIARIVLSVTDAPADPNAGEVALDLARMLDVPFCVMRVRLPGYLAAPDTQLTAFVESVQHRASLQDVKVELVELEGNPVRQWVKASRRDDLCVVGRKKQVRDSYASPDVAIRFARASTCSVLVCTAHEP